MNRSAQIRLWCFLAALLTLLAGPVSAQLAAYDPLRVSDKHSPEWLDLTVDDTGRHRAIPIRVYFPFNKSPAPVVLCSHGLGGSRAGSAYLAKHWSARGYLCVFLQHPGSDAFVWKDKPLGQRMKAMREAA